MRETGHLTVDELVAHLDGTLSRADLTDVELHLAECAVCRDELIATRRLVRSRSGSGRQVWRVGAILLAASLVLSIPIARARFRSDTDTERAMAQSAVPIVIVSPVEDATVRSDSLRFVWASVHGGVRVQYRVTITDASGGALWRAETEDTTLVPAGASLHSGTSYLWFVDALLPDGRARTSGTHRFATAP